MKSFNLIFLILMPLFISCTNLYHTRVKDNLNDKYATHNIYYLDQLKYNNDYSTNVRYRGKIYSDYLKEQEFPKSIEIGVINGQDKSYLTLYDDFLKEYYTHKKITTILESIIKNPFRLNLIMDKNRIFNLSIIIYSPKKLRIDKKFADNINNSLIQVGFEKTSIFIINRNIKYLKSTKYLKHNLFVPFNSNPKKLITLSSKEIIKKLDLNIIDKLKSDKIYFFKEIRDDFKYPLSLYQIYSASELSYLDWHLLSKKYRNSYIKDILQNPLLYKKIKNNYLNNKSFHNYLKKDKIYSTFYKSQLIKDMKFLYGANHLTLKKDIKNSLISDKDSGFQAYAFSYNDFIIISYRGSSSPKEIFADDDSYSDWLETNLKIGFGEYTDQLSLAKLFYEKIVNDYPDKKIIITGHSLGGALAEFVFIISGGKHRTVVFNGLGIGDKNKGLSLTIDNIKISALKTILKKHGLLDKKGNHFIPTEKQLYQIKDDYNNYLLFLRNWHKELSTINEPIITDTQLKELLIDKNEENLFINSLDYNLRSLHNFEKNYNYLRNSVNIINLYFKDDLTYNLQQHIGLNLEVTSDNTHFDTRGSSIFRKLKNMLDFFGDTKYLEKHPVQNFLPYIEKYNRID